MVWLGVAREPLDDDHAPAAARAWTGEGRRLGKISWLSLRLWRGDQRPGTGEVVHAAARGKRGRVVVFSRSSVF